MLHWLLWTQRSSQWCEAVHPETQRHQQLDRLLIIADAIAMSNPWNIPVEIKCGDNQEIKTKSTRRKSLNRRKKSPSQPTQKNSCSHEWHMQIILNTLKIMKIGFPLGIDLPQIIRTKARQPFSPANLFTGHVEAEQSHQKPPNPLPGNALSQRANEASCGTNSCP